MACNSGVSLVPKVEGQLYHFEYVGLYNGLALVRDRETDSFWSHYTGECVHGQHQGYQLEFIAPIQHMTARQALKRYPDAEAALARQSLFAKLFSRLMQVTCLTPKGTIPPHFYKTMAEADERRPRLDIGLGVWVGKTARYYPMETLQTEPLIIDELNGQRLFIIIEPDSQIPVAFYTNAVTAQWQNGELHLDNGEIVRDGQLHTAEGEIRLLNRPAQQFTRWYGFAYTFPDCDLFTR